MNQLVNDISNFNNEHISKFYSLTQSIYLKNHITYHPWHQLDSSMVKTNQNFMSTRRFKLFSSIYIFRQLIMNIYYENMIERIGNSEDDYRGYIQRIIIMQVIQLIFCEMLIGGRKIVNSDIILKSLISGQMFKMILRSLKGYLTKWCQRNPLWDKWYVTLMGMVK